MNRYQVCFFFHDGTAVSYVYSAKSRAYAVFLSSRDIDVDRLQRHHGALKDVACFVLKEPEDTQEAVSATTEEEDA